MNKFFKILVSLVACAGLLVGGCATNGSGKVIDIDKVILVAKLASYDGTFLYLSKHPDQKPKFILASQSLSALIEHGVSVEGLVAVLDALPIKQLDSTEGRLIIDSAIIIFGSYFDTKVAFNELEKANDLKLVANAIKDGVDRALAAVN